MSVQLIARETRSVHVRARDVAGALVLTAVLVGGVVFFVLGSMPR
jgi:multidrug efflux pump subunit AcrB